MTDSLMPSFGRFVPALFLLLILVGCGGAPDAGQGGLSGSWRAQVDLAGGPLRFHMELNAAGDSSGTLCNAGTCDALSAVRALPGDSVLLEMGDYAAAIRAHVTADSLVGFYRNVGNRGPRTIPFRAARGTWPIEPPAASLLGRWDAIFTPDATPSPRVLEFRETERGLEGTVISNTGDSGLYWGGASDEGFVMSHFDGSFIYMLTGGLDGDTLRGVFHAGATSQRPFVAVRSTGAPHLRDPNELVTVDATTAFEWDFPDLDGNFVSNNDERFQGKVVIVEIFGTWCPTCHDSAPTMVKLYDMFHDRGLEIVGLSYEVTGDPAIDGPLVERFGEKFGIEYPLLLAGVNDDDSPGETQPQLSGPIAFPTAIFIDPSGQVRRVHSGFFGPALGEVHEELEQELIEFTEQLLQEAGR